MINSAAQDVANNPINAILFSFDKIPKSKSK